MLGALYGEVKRLGATDSALNSQAAWRRFYFDVA
jgi:hypothetical protein